MWGGGREGQNQSQTIGNFLFYYWLLSMENAGHCNLPDNSCLLAAASYIRMHNMLARSGCWAEVPMTAHHPHFIRV